MDLVYLDAVLSKAGKALSVEGHSSFIRTEPFAYAQVMSRKQCNR
jgi:hypothetical protein